ncbi:MAG: hypothetical protein WDN04_13985 [Rhodospirillales bacterium]
MTEEATRKPFKTRTIIIGGIIFVIGYIIVARHTPSPQVTGWQESCVSVTPGVTSCNEAPLYQHCYTGADNELACYNSAMPP